MSGSFLSLGERICCCRSGIFLDGWLEMHYSFLGRLVLARSGPLKRYVENQIMYEQIFRNLPGNPNWEGSFYEQLTEFGKWNRDEFWKLHLELLSVAQFEARSETLDRAVALAVVTLYSKISSLISANYNTNDVFKIVNLTNDDLGAFTERLQHAVLSVFSGKIIPESSYDLTNPLIVGH